MCGGQGETCIPRGFHRQPLDIKEKLESIRLTLPEDLTYYKEFICYDFESMFKNISVSTEKMEFIAKHCPVSYVISESQAETLSQCHEDPKQLIDCFIRDLST